MKMNKKKKNSNFFIMVFGLSIYKKIDWEYPPYGINKRVILVLRINDLGRVKARTIVG